MLGFKIVLLVCIATVAYSLPLSQHEGHPREPAPQCDPGEEDDCSRCYDVLANQVIINDKNRYNMQKAFFPPDKSSPVFVMVTYYFTRNMTGDGSTNYSLTEPSETWYWTQSAFYLFQPIETIQYTSLLFSDSLLHKSNLSLYLQPNCWQGNNTAMMKLLTQRLKLYAMEQSIAAKIDDAYIAKGETLETLRSFHKGKHFTNYTFSFQIVFPIVVIVFLCLLFHHRIENNNLFKILRRSPPPQRESLPIHPEIPRRGSLPNSPRRRSLPEVHANSPRRGSLPNLPIVPVKHHQQVASHRQLVNTNLKQVVTNLQLVDENLKASLTKCKSVDEMYQRAAVNIHQVDASLRQVANNLQKVVALRSVLPGNHRQAAKYLENVGNCLKEIATTLKELLEIHEKEHVNFKQVLCRKSQLVVAVNRQQVVTKLQQLARTLQLISPTVDYQEVINELEKKAENIKDVVDASPESFPHHVYNAKVSNTNMAIVITVICAYTFVIYVCVLDCIAVGYRQERVKELIFFRTNTLSDSSLEDVFILEYAIPILMLLYDAFSLIIFSIVGICCRCGVFKSWFYILLAPLSCIVTHSYHILVAFIHTPHHATSILIFYGLVVIVFIVTLTTAYHNLHQMVKCCETGCDRQIKQSKRTQDFRLCCANKFWGWSCCIEHRWPHQFVITVMCLLSALIAGFMVYIVILFILIPINNAIDEAPDRLLSINQTALIFFGAAITYKLYRIRKSITFLDYLVKAQNEYEQHANGETGNAVDGWKTMNPNDKKIKLASRLLGAVDALKSS